MLPGTKETFQLLTNGQRKFWLPTVFVTNAGNDLRQNKAKQLTNWLECQVIALYYACLC